MIKKRCGLLPLKSIYRIIALIMCLPVLLSAVCFPAAALQSNIKTVKAGIFSFDGYHMLNENGEYVGYGIDFLNMVSQYSNINFEYVGFDRSWNDMLTMLENGEIDIVTSARKTPEREEMFAFSVPIGRNDTVLAIRDDNQSFYAGNYRSYNGMTIGLLKGNSQNERLKSFAKDKGFSYNSKEFESVNELTEALHNRSIDAILSSNLRKMQSEKILDTIHSDNFYAIVRKDKAELLNDINYAVEQMNINKGDWSNNLFYKHYAKNYSNALEFTEREREYIRKVASGEKTITVTSIGDRNPYSYVENGTLKGILPDFFAEVMKIAGLPYQTVIPETREDYYQMANNNYVDVVIDRKTDSLSNAHSDSGFFTDVYMTTSIARITRKNFSDDIYKVAVTDLQNDALIEQSLTDGLETIHFDKRDDAIRAVLDKKADAAYAYTYTAQSFINNNNLDNDLKFTIISGHRYAFQMYIRNTCDHDLVNILNKCIKQIPDDTLNQLVTKYTAYNPDNISINAYLRMHPALSILISISFVSSLSVFILIVLRMSYSKRLLDEKDKANDEMERQLNIVNALSRDYLNIYSVNANTKTLRIIKLDGYVTTGFDDIDGEFPYDSSIFQYVRERVCKEERSQLIEALSLRNVLRELQSKSEYTGIYHIEADGEIHTIQYIYIDMYNGRSRRKSDHMITVGFRNIDDMIRKEQEQQEILAKALAEAQHANTAKTTFLNNMSHDIRTPMNAIIGFTNLASAHIDSKDKVLDYLDKVLVSSKHLLSLINDVLDMSRIESGKVKIEEEETSLPEIIHSLKTIVQSDVKAKQLDFCIDTVDVTNETVICDKLRLSQVLLNILSNAMKYTNPGGKVSIRIIQTEPRKDGFASYEFRIKDSGIGMSKEFLQHLFEPFERERTATVSGIQGTGLGLAITKNIIDMMQGTVTVESQVDVGTEFIVSFNFRTVKNAADNQYLDKLSGLHALVVDDDINTCTSVSRMLSSIGMHPEWTTLGKEAIVRTQFAIEEGEPFNVFIIDWYIPDMNGVETARRIRRITGGDIPIIILTAYDWSDVEEEALEAGVTAFCSKPVFLSELSEILTAPYRTDEEEQEKKNAEASEESLADTLNGKNILLVEDNELNREIAKTVLEEYGIVVYTAENGQEALEQVEKNRYDTFSVILMDIQMPIMDGYQASRKIRAMTDTAKASIPIIAMTANAFEEDKQKAAEAGMNGHIAKPIDIPVLLETLKDILV